MEHHVNCLASCRSHFVSLFLECWGNMFVLTVFVTEPTVWGGWGGGILTCKETCPVHFFFPSISVCVSVSVSLPPPPRQREKRREAPYWPACLSVPSCTMIPMKSWPSWSSWSWAMHGPSLKRRAWRVCTSLLVLRPAGSTLSLACHNRAIASGFFTANRLGLDTITLRKHLLIVQLDERLWLWY